MALSRLQNIGANPTGVVIYVDSGNFDATDSIENRGISPLRPFFSIQRALIESARYSYQIGRNNDRNNRTTIMVAPGTHYIDNRPGYSIENLNGSAVFKKRTGKNTWSTTTLSPFGEDSNFDIFDPNNDLYKYNSVNGGVILPRGTSIVGQDLRKTKIKPLYVPDPLDEDVERSSILNVTGGCYFTSFTFFDADTTKFSYKNYSDSKHVPKYSHHKLTTFTYADGVNPVKLGSNQTYLTDLDMYYYKITRAYDSLSGRGLEDYPISLDFEPSIDEFRIVGALQENPLGISSIRAGNGDGTGDNSIITVTTANLQTKIEEPHNFAVDTPIIIQGVTDSPTAYNGSFTVREVVGVNTFTFITPVIPSEVLPDSSTFDIATVSVESDTVTSASPYIFNCSLRSVYGLCGMWADGSKATGFKSMVVAQFTGVSLQKDDDAYVIYDDGLYYDNITLPASSELRPLHQNSRAIYKPQFENFHVRASNDAFIQAVSVFAIGYAKHFLTESGADMSITNSNSNFGANSLSSIGFRNISFNRDDTGYITHIIPPKELIIEDRDVTWLSLDVAKIQSVANPKKLFIYSYDSKDIPPASQVDGYRVGARANDKLYLTLTGNNTQTTYTSPIYMDAPGGFEGLISKKEYFVSRVGSLNNITSTTLTLTETHKLFTGEKVRIFSDNAKAPDGLDIDKIYYAITNQVEGSLGGNQIRLASTLNDAISNLPISGINNNGGIIKVLSTVSDKVPGDYGHPIQWDSVNNNWYIVSSQFAINEIYSTISTLNVSTFGSETPSTFIKRVQENRSAEERLYKVRYVIPKEYINAKAPQTGYIIQESKNVAISSVTVDEGTSLLNSTELRNDKVIVDASVGAVVNGSQIVTVTTEIPHNFIPGDVLKIQGIRSSNNPNGTGIVSTYNGEYEVISIPSSRKFTYSIDGVNINPGTFTNNVNSRTTRQQRDALPLVSRQKYKNNFYIYKVNTIRDHTPGVDGQDGIYHLTVLSSSVGLESNVGYGLSQKYFRQDIKNLYPQIDRDNPESNPNSTISYADLKIVGKVITDDRKKSITLEALNEFNKNTRIGFGITGITISGTGNTTLTIYTDIEHKLNSIKNVSFVSNGSGYTPNTTIYSAPLLDSSLNEEDSSCKYSTTVSGTVDSNNFRILDSGAAHVIGEQLNVSGGAINAVVQVSEINNNIGDGLELAGFHSTNLNGVYEIVGVPNKKAVTIHVPGGLSQYTANTNSSLPIGYIASKGVGVSSIVLSDLNVGIATVTTSYPHGLSSGNKFKFVNSNLNFYNKDFTVSSVIGISTFTFNVGVATTTTTPSSGKILKYGISSNGLNLGRGEENLASRACYIYDGLTARTSVPITLSSSTLTLDSANGLKRGDFIYVNNEILRIASFPVSNTFNVLRGQLGTVRTTAVSGAIVRKIKVFPVETRRPSFMRASGHTFEYLGYGPGNYSTALPQRQDRILDADEVLVSQAKREQGGSIVYTGMNDLGEFYTGSTKVSATTGEETVVDAPILSYTGDDAEGEGRDRQSGVFDELLVRDRITVEGGDNNNQSSQFYGPVSFNKKITNLSDEGILTKNLYIRGNVSQEKLLTVGISTPTSLTVPNPTIGDISFLSNPNDRNNIGYVYKNNEWREWGLITNKPGELSFTVNKLGVGVAPNDSYQLNVAGVAQIENLRVTAGVIFTQPFNLGDVRFEDIDVYGTVTFLGYNPETGISTSYTQIHEQGTSKLNQLEVVGIASFTKDVYINRPDQFGVIPTLYADRLDLSNIRVGIANSNTIDTKYGDLILDSNSGTAIINSNLLVQDGNVAITTSRNIGLPNLGVVTAYITESRLVKLGVGNTNQASYIEFNNDIRVFPDYGLRLERSSGIGSVSSSLIHRGTSPLFINSFDNSNVSILTNNTERIRVGSSGTITIYQNNAENNLKGTHLRLTQAGSGDVAISWDITNNNANRRWYAGIDVSDGYSWKLSCPTVVTAYGAENFDNDIKLKLDTSGNLTINSGSGILNIDGTQFTSTANGTFNLLNTNILQVNAFGNADTVNLAKSSIISKVNILGTTDASSTSTGALVVNGGVGIAKKLWVGDNTNINGDLYVEKDLTVNGAATIDFATITEGSINNTIIGNTTRAAASFTSINANANSTFGGAVVDSLILKKYGEVVSNLGFVSGNREINLNDGNVFTATLSGTTTFSITNPLSSTNAGTSFTLILRNGSGGPFGINWPGSVKFPNNTPPLRTTEAGKTDIWIFITPDQGTTWYANVALYNFS